MDTGVPLLKMENIGKEYFGNRVLQDVSFSLQPGEIMGLVGENGAGKTNILDAVYYLAFCKSCFSSSDKLNIKHGETFFAISIKKEPKYAISCFNKPLALVTSSEPRLFEQTNSAGESVVCAPVVFCGLIS